MVADALQPRGPDLDIQETLLLSPDVARCEVRDGVAFVVRAEKPLLSRVLAFSLSQVSEQDLREFLADSFGCQQEAVPEIRFVDELPRAQESAGGPFMLEHILDALFRELDDNEDGAISLSEFVDFCTRYGLLTEEADGLRRVFGVADGRVLLGFDVHLDAAKFKKLILDTGIVEVRTGPAAHYFVEEHVAELVLRRWFARYDTNGDEHIDLEEFSRLVVDYKLPCQVCVVSFRRYDTNSDGHIDVQEFMQLLKDANVLATGPAIMKRHDAEGLRAKWRALEPTQRFLPTSLVLDAGAVDLPPKVAGMVRFVCISDTHGKHEDITDRLPSGDVLLHAGDFSMTGDLDELMSFAKWLRSLPYAVKLVIPGNHDMTLDRSLDRNMATPPEVARQAIRDAAGPTVRFLEDEEAVVHGLRIWGSPWQPMAGDWAFSLRRGTELAAKWHAIPAGVDILMVHGPPLGRGDAVLDGHHVGCADLLCQVQNRIRPAFCVSGHIHEGRGVSWDGVTHYVNATSCDSDYECAYAPWVFDLPARS